MPTPKGHQHDVALDELDCTSGQAYLTGTDILARLPAIQRKIDAAAGHNTAGYVTGYPGSPLSGLDSLLRRDRSRSASASNLRACSPSTPNPTMCRWM